MSGMTTATAAAARLREPPRLQLIAQLIDLEGIDPGSEGAPEGLDPKRAAGLAPTLLGNKAPAEDRVHHLLERDLQPVRQLPELHGHVVVERQRGSPG